MTVGPGARRAARPRSRATGRGALRLLGPLPGPARPARLERLRRRPASWIGRAARAPRPGSPGAAARGRCPRLSCSSHRAEAWARRRGCASRWSGGRHPAAGRARAAAAWAAARCVRGAAPRGARARRPLVAGGCARGRRDRERARGRVPARAAPAAGHGEFSQSGDRGRALPVGSRGELRTPVRAPSGELAAGRPSVAELCGAAASPRGGSHHGRDGLVALPAGAPTAPLSGAGRRGAPRGGGRVLDAGDVGSGQLRGRPGRPRRPRLARPGRELQPRLAGVVRWQRPG